jgi:hypothetical protein
VHNIDAASCSRINISQNIIRRQLQSLSHDPLPKAEAEALIWAAAEDTGGHLGCLVQTTRGRDANTSHGGPAPMLSACLCPTTVIAS